MMDAREVIARAIRADILERSPEVRGYIADWPSYLTEADAALSAYHAHLKASGRVIVPVEAVPYEELAVLHGQQVVVTFKDSKDAFEFFNRLKSSIMIAAAKEPTDG